MRVSTFILLSLVCVAPAWAQQTIVGGTHARITNRMVVGGTTFGDVLRIVGSGTVSSGTGTINPAVIDADGDVLEDSNTTVSTAGAWTWGGAGTFSSTLGVTGNTTLTGTLLGGSGTLLLASPTRISTSSPALRFHESDAGTDLKYWEIVADGGVIKFRALDDALSVGNSLFELTRTSGITLGDFRFGSGVSTVRPENNGGGSLGSVPKKWLQVNAWELVVDTLVARDKIATINGDVVVAPTTTLTRDIVAADTTVYVKHNQSRTNDVWLLQGNGAMEKMTVTSNAIDCNVSGNCAVAGVDFKYTVTRGINGTGANDWSAGSAAVNEGNVGDGMIHAYSDRSAAFGGYPDLVISDTPAVYFRMDDDTSTQSFDEMESGLAATEGGTQSAGLGVGATAWSSVADPIWEDTGGAGYLSVTDTAGLRITGNLTLEFFAAWQRTTARTEVIISKHYEAEYHLQVASDGTLQFCHGTSVGPTFTCVSSAVGYVPNDTSTHHYAVVRDADSSPKRILFYKDGVLTDTFTYTQSVTTSTNNVVIGSNPVALSGNMFDGYLDEVAIYTYQLPADRIALHYSARQNASISKFTVGPTIVGYVRTGTGAFDLAERWGLGNLAGTFGYSSSTTPVYGFASGNASATWVSVDATNGFRVMNGSTEKLKADTSGNLSLTGNLTMGTAGVFSSGTKPDCSVPFGTGIYMAYNAGTPVFCIGTPADYVQWNGTDLTILSNNFSVKTGGVFVNPRTTATWATDYGYNFDSAFSGDKPALWSYETSTERRMRLDNKTTQSARTAGLSFAVDDEDTDGAAMTISTGTTTNGDSEISISSTNFVMGSTNFVVGGNNGLTTTVVVPCGTLTYTKGVLTNKGAC
jgi:hypothetical protein